MHNFAALSGAFGPWSPAVKALAFMLVAFAAFIEPTDGRTSSHPEAAPAADPFRAVVSVRSSVPSDARTARTLGTQREGNGVVIDSKGLVLTIGYLIMEAQFTEVVGSDGKAVPATVVAYDHDSGFGLLRAIRPLGVDPIPLGDSTKIEAGSRVLVVSVAGGRQVTPARVVSRRVFAGYWEYLLEDAIFTMPAHLQFGGAALIGEDGTLLGVGSLFVNDALDPQVFAPGNMFVPINGLKPILGDLVRHGRHGKPPRPWLGVHTADANGRVVVIRISDEGPAKRAGLRPGDIILGVDGKRVKDMADFLRKTWAFGEAGASIPLDIVRPGSGESSVERVTVRSVDRYKWLKIHKGF
jgi:S1-C subfamily serine protease